MLIIYKDEEINKENLINNTNIAKRKSNGRQ